MKIIELLKSKDLENKYLGVELFKNLKDYNNIKKLSRLSSGKYRSLDISFYIEQIESIKDLRLDHPYKVSMTVICIEQILKILEYQNIDLDI